MADLGSALVSEIDASNNAVPPNGFPEGMQPSGVNNSARAVMGADKRFWDRSNATATTSGTSTNFVLTYTGAQAALYDGEETSFVLHATCGATPTLNRDGLGAKLMRKYDIGTSTFVSIAAGDFRIRQVLRVRYNLAADRYDVIAASFSPSAFLVSSTNNTFTGTNTFAGTVTMSGAAFNEAARVDMASATTCSIGAAASNYVRITGTTTITGLGTIGSGTRRHVVFSSALTLTHNAVSLILPNAGDNIVTAAGDCALFESEGSGNWRCMDYQRADGTTVASSVGSQVGRAYAATIVFTTITNNIPYDDTIPQITEGDFLLTVGITPKSTTNRVRVTVKVPISAPPTFSGVAAIALFRNAGANAIDSTFVHLIDGIAMYPAVLMFEDSPASIALQTYTVRAGGQAGVNIVINGDSTGRLGGGTSRASIAVDEFVS